ncbi:heme peroxidase [Mytilinidion resinicola]|uniref:Peroxidase n=1 Tax=Mytilinidion resinicola TaxID=574789 RepID=A0A6A6XZ34_9PEZI|nr:heme peroxidase [Mytilinidion resinicola]KAF2801649.1 heme peroxidase [Mytilinidion resinicola]
MFAGTFALPCTDDALAAIRAGFHDCFPGDGGCDGSLIPGNEYERTKNNSLADISQQLAALAAKYEAGTADMIFFAASHSIMTCLLGLVAQTFIRRTDSTTAAPEGVLPGHTQTAEAILIKFTTKGFLALHFVALLGTHSTAKQFFVDPSHAGARFDATPGQWDVTYYGQVVTDTAEFQLNSDKRIIQDANMAPLSDLFTVDKVGWAIVFTTAWRKMQLLGVEGGPSNPNSIDCTSARPVVPAAGGSVKRNGMPAP